MRLSEWRSNFDEKESTLSVLDSLYDASAGIQRSLERLDQAASRIADPNGTDQLAESLVDLNLAQHEAAANRAVVHAVDETVGTLLDEIV